MTEHLKFVVFNGTGEFRCEYKVAKNFAGPLLETIALYSKPPYTPEIIEEPLTKTEENNVTRRGKSPRAKPEPGSDDSSGIVTE
jgi:hypothetical protein